MSIPALVTGAVVLVMDRSREELARRRLERLVAALRAGRPLADVLARHAGRPFDRGGVPRARRSRLAHPQGRPRAGPGDLALTALVSGGRPAAVVEHGAGVVLPELESALDVPARLALENERLSAALAARLLQVSRSRALVVELGDRERRRVERDLHDGVQQHLLALGFDLRLASADLPVGHPELAVLDRCLEETKAALAELRQLSRGVYPPMLATGGLAAAVTALVRRALVPVQVRGMPEGRLPAPVERAAYAIVADAAARGEEDGVSVACSLEGGVLQVRIGGAPVDLAGVIPDVVAALGGTIVSPGPDLEVHLPCGS